MSAISLQGRVAGLFVATLLALAVVAAPAQLASDDNLVAQTHAKA